MSRPIHINRVPRAQGFLKVRNELGLELPDAGASDAFAVADHQAAHVYLNHPAREKQLLRTLEAISGIERILGESEKNEAGLNHPRSGRFVCIAKKDAWFTYYYWLDDRNAPDFARTVDIHRKPGYDPCELFIDPRIRFPFAKTALKLAASRLGFRTLLDLIPLDAALVKGSHGRVDDSPQEGPLVISLKKGLMSKETFKAEEIFGLILDHLTQT